MQAAKTRWMGKLLWGYVVIFAAGSVIIVINNILLHNSTLAGQMSYTIKAILAGDALLVLLFGIVTYARLRPVLRLAGSEPLGETEKSEMVNRLFRFPKEMFWVLVGASLLLSVLFHLFQYLHYHGPISGIEWKWIRRTGQNLLAEMTLALTLGIMLYSFLRRSIRPFIKPIHNTQIQGIKPSSFMEPMVIVFVSGLFILIFNIVRYAQMAGEDIELSNLLLLTGLYGLLALIVFAMLSLECKRDFSELIAAIRSLLSGGRAELHRQVPIMSHDEIGRLASAFNKLQGRITQEYEAVERELKLAYEVQNKLIPQGLHRLNRLWVCGSCRSSREVGGDFFDVVDLGEGRTGVIIGDVCGKGLQAALVMSAVLMMVRTEIRKGGSAGEVLTRLNELLADMLRGEGYVTMGLGIFDAEAQTVGYASAGHLAPYRTDAGSGFHPLDCSALPLGIADDVCYSGVLLPFREGDRFILYTDGVVEVHDEAGGFFGFERFAACLDRLDARDEPEIQLRKLLDTIPKKTKYTLHDDQTLVLISYAAEHT